MLGKLNINNPGNIRISSDRFIGEIVPSIDPDFKQFSSMAYGYRAMFKILNTYRNYYGLVTISSILHRYAPPSDNNNTQAYINYVSGLTGYSPHQTLVYDNDTLLSLGYAISYYENGIQPNLQEVEEGLRLAEIINIVKGVSIGGVLLLGVLAVIIFSRNTQPSIPE